MRFALIVLGLIAAVTAQNTQSCAGVDAFYACYPVTYNWEEISGNSNAVSFGTGDDNERPFTLPFEFSLYGNASADWYASTNGYISTSSVGKYYCDVSGCSFPTGEVDASMVAPLLADLYGVSTSWFGGMVFGTAPNRHYVIEWNNWSSFDAQNTTIESLIFQLKLFEGSNKFEFHYKSLIFSNTVGSEWFTAGMQDWNCTAGTTWWHTNRNATQVPVPVSGLAVAFIPRSAYTDTNVDTSAATSSVVASLALCVFAVVAMFA